MFFICWTALTDNTVNYLLSTVDSHMFTPWSAPRCRPAVPAWPGPRGLQGGQAFTQASTACHRHQVQHYFTEYCPSAVYSYVTKGTQGKCTVYEEKANQESLVQFCLNLPTDSYSITVGPAILSTRRV